MVTEGEILSGRYLVKDELGSGGMGVVFRAVDLRTGASVAVKAPHGFLVRDSVYLERLRREAQMAASLHSPRVAMVTDFAEHGGVPYLVMEFVPGENLAERLARTGPLSTEDALRIGLEVARALEESHAAGIVHRDLKPQNIRITPRGDVKVLDFGIARLDSHSGLTDAGTVMGSPEYLAPERAEGQGDIRADLYALGIVLYELLTGAVPFTGGTPWSVMRRHTQEPPAPLPAGVSPAAAAIVARCLAKRPEDRYQTPGELAAAIQEALQPPAAPPAPRGVAPTVVQPRNPPPAPTVIQPRAPAPRPTVVLPLDTPPKPGLDDQPAAPPAPPHPPPAVRGLRRPPAVALALSGAAVVVAAVLVLVLATRGGSGTPRASVTAAPGASSTTGGPIELAIVAPTQGGHTTSPVRVEVSVHGATLKPPAAADPAARHLHYFVDTDPAAVLGPGQPVPTGVQNIIHTPATSQALDLAPGPHTVWVVLTDNDHIPLSPPVQARTSFTVESGGAVARTGEQAPIVYQSLVDGKWRLFVIGGAGQPPQLLSTGAWDDVEPAWSPDGARVVFASNREGRFHLYTMNADGSDARQLTRGNAHERNPAWSPDSKFIAFSSDRDGGLDQIFVVPAEGGELRQVTRGAGGGSQPAWSPDGRQLAFVRVQGDTTHIMVVSADGGDGRQITTAAQRHIDPAWSPDGRRIAFAAFHDRQWNIFVMNPDGSDVRQVTNQDLNRNPSWSPDGRQLVFASGREGQQQIFAIPIQGGQVRRLTEGLAHNLHPAWPLR